MENVLFLSVFNVRYDYFISQTLKLLCLPVTDLDYIPLLMVKLSCTITTTTTRSGFIAFRSTNIVLFLLPNISHVWMSR